MPMRQVVVFVVLVAAGAGCGDRTTRLAVVPTRGQVTMDGKPAAGALLIFHSVEGGEGLPVKPRARVRGDGSFVAETYAAGDGMPAGEYVVTVEWRKQTAEEGAEGESLAPARYAKRESSPVKVRVGPDPDGACELAPIRILR